MCFVCYSGCDDVHRLSFLPVINPTLLIAAGIDLVDNVKYEIHLDSNPPVFPLSHITALFTSGITECVHTDMTEQ